MTWPGGPPPCSGPKPPTPTPMTPPGPSPRTNSRPTSGATLASPPAPAGSPPAGGPPVLSGARVTLTADGTWPVPPLPPSVAPAEPEPGVPAIIVSDRARPPHDAPTVTYRPPSLVIGLGASRGVPPEEISALIAPALAAGGLSPRSVRAAATVDLKQDEPGLLAAVQAHGWPLTFFSAADLAEVPVPNPSPTVNAAVGTPSVAEAARLRAAGQPATLVVPKQISPHATVAVARRPPRGRLAIVGIGPGARDLLTPRAVAELRRARIVIGLDQYLDQVADLFRPGTVIRSSGLGQEQERAAAAAAEAAAGDAVALIGSGDAGIYAMGSPALEPAGLDIEVVGVPGVTAALAAAAVLGAPLGHD